MANVALGTIYDELSFTMIPGGSALYKLNDHDGVMLPYLKNILKTDTKQFVVVHTSGSHWSYAHRYPREFAKFTPECNITGKNDPASCAQVNLVNAYDNSILYTDFFLSNLIEMLKDEEAFLIYASDHGESLGESGRFGHAGEITFERTSIPLIVWVSDSFKQKHPVHAENINTHKGQRLSHDNIFHSVLDCLDISSEIIDKNLSICNGTTNG
jgi:glucan phosphoethanolaminetransferase (alkaline phosphatase superfamily)